ncbi:hypothetical protein SPSPH_022480 [Sporomusa sphaeroides DSM 2875]|uniref:Uncharacterized protein n=1 Tax=Sporomusa sphaeroides DSM 2875 TaxID=1337886 RepID=A0ABM9W3Z1_9FIRM|nr:hypothetical protein SPSPH_22150 [Sporomusa sphaeroides DSM 2875]CVK19834.1 hypothetical protein SSPH_02490 [Sporomusa sphaeroides DSM 2875]
MADKADLASGGVYPIRRLVALIQGVINSLSSRL